MVFMVRIISEDAEDSKGTEQNSLGFQSLFLLARLDRVLTREDVDSSQREEDDEEDGELHACIIPHSPGITSGRACICAGFFGPKPLAANGLRSPPAAPAPKGKSFLFISQPRRGDQHSPEDSEDEPNREEGRLGTGIVVRVL